MSFESRRFFWSAPAERSGDGALVWSSAFMRLLTNHETGLNAELRTDPKRCRATLATALQKGEQP
jgi:hypothetical protein